MYRHFCRDNNAARKQQQDWEMLVSDAKRAAAYKPCPCVYCGTTMTLLQQSDLNNLSGETADHIFPRSKGGHATVKCCVACNRDKHHLTIAEWRAVISLRRRRPHLFHYERIAVRNTLTFATLLLSRLISL